MLKCALAIVTVLAVVVGGLLKLPLLPFRALRGLIRHKAGLVRLTAG